MLGAFRQLLSVKNFRVRWLSDASSWMYLMYLPLVFVAQGIVARLGLPPLISFVLICATVVPLLLLSYRYLVRYSFVGTLLNGPRSRDADDTQRAALRSTDLATASVTP